MDAIETAIRNALAKGNAEDRSFREKVYRSAFAALDRALQANPGVTVETAINRRKAMQVKIAEIESEFLPAVPDVEPTSNVDQAAPVDAPAEAAPHTDAPSAPSPAVEGGSSIASQGSDADSSAPVIDKTDHSHVLPVVPDIMPEPALAGSPRASGKPDGGATSSDEVMPDGDARRARRGRMPLTAIFLGITLLAASGIGMWWVVQTGAFKTPEELGNLPSQPATLDDEDYTPTEETAAPQKSGQTDQSRQWITVFTPANPALVSAPSDAQAEVMRDDTGSFLRVRSGSSGSAVSFDVGQGILEQVSGKHAVFDVIARAEEGQKTQLSVDCNFGELGDCGRKRYAVGHERNEYLFDVQFPDKNAGAAGTIAINSDFDKKGKSVDIYEIRVSIVE